MTKCVYLAGPITGLSYGGANEWRDAFAEQLEARGVRGLSPMRGKSYLDHEERIWDSYEDSLLSSQKSIVTRDRNDATTCDLLVVNLLGATRVSIGTMVELGWADAHRVPIVVVMEESGNPHDHAFVRELAGWRVTNLQDALTVALSVVG